MYIYICMYCESVLCKSGKLSELCEFVLANDLGKIEQICNFVQYCDYKFACIVNQFSSGLSSSN